MRSACTRLPRPIAIIFMRPLSYGPWKSVCGFTRFTTIVADALDASASVTTFDAADLRRQLDDVHARAHRAAEVLLVEPVRRQHLALALSGCAAVASHRRHHEGLGALARAPRR